MNTKTDENIAVFSDELVVKWANQTVLNTLLIYRELIIIKTPTHGYSKLRRKIFPFFYFAIHF